MLVSALVLTQVASIYTAEEAPIERYKSFLKNSEEASIERYKSFLKNSEEDLEITEAKFPKLEYWMDKYLAKKKIKRVRWEIEALKKKIKLLEDEEASLNDK